MLLLNHSDDLINPQDCDVIEEYKPDDGSQGYDVVSVEVDTPDQILVMDSDHRKWTPLEIEDRYVSAWEEYNPTDDETISADEVAANYI